jgi:hypothetical protein
VIAINKSSSNTVVVTVKEKTTLPVPVYYLFEFKNDETNVLYYCIGAEVATAWEDRSKFTITEQASPNPVLGQILLPGGDYHYKIYEQASSTNIDPTGLTVVEIGLATCYITPRVNKDYANASLENKVYG